MAMSSLAQNKFVKAESADSLNREGPMFARKVAARLKPNSLMEFVRVMECEILPWLRMQEGFLDLIMLATPDGSEVATISFWDHQDSVPACHSRDFPQVLKVLEDLLEGAPYVKTFEVVGSTRALRQGNMSDTDELFRENDPEPGAFDTQA
jgi:hypothetical protein